MHKNLKSSLNAFKKRELTGYVDAAPEKKRLTILQRASEIFLDIMGHMKARHFEDKTTYLSLDEILGEIDHTRISIEEKNQVRSSLCNNPRIQNRTERKRLCFRYKPPLAIKDHTDLYVKLMEHFNHGQGGILVEDLKESTGNAQNCIDSLKLQDMCHVYCPKTNNKQGIVFYKNCVHLDINEEFKNIWRSCGLPPNDPTNAEEYRQLSINRPKMVSQVKKRKRPRRTKNSKFENEHLDNGTLIDYDH
ncbi:hypothetical protein SNEBB_004759 [Seison nebaliae]|nr:hypothetical protein SNEBB_004759 [Seison nebaliae]